MITIKGDNRKGIAYKIMTLARPSQVLVRPRAAGRCRGRRGADSRSETLAINV